MLTAMIESIQHRQRARAEATAAPCPSDAVLRLASRPTRVVDIELRRVVDDEDPDMTGWAAH